MSACKCTRCGLLVEPVKTYKSYLLQWREWQRIEEDRCMGCSDGGPVVACLSCRRMTERGWMIEGQCVMCREAGIVLLCSPIQTKSK